MAIRVLLVDIRSTRAATLRAALEDAGFDVVGVVSEDADLYEAVETLAPDAVLADTNSPSRDSLEHLAMLGRENPRPLIMLAAHDDRAMLKQAADAGLSPYVVEGISSALMRSLVDVSIRHFESHQALRTELEDARSTMASRKVIDRAKSLLMERHGLSERDAYSQLRKTAMNRGQSLADLARQVLEAGAL
jgi:response regulator NasT